jgi:CHASE2 domain-containing protein
VTEPTAPAAAPAPGTFRGAKGIVLESLLLASAALFFLNFNPLGALNVGHRYSQDLVYAWFGHTSWLYPRIPAHAERAMQMRPRVVVMLIDDAALALRGAHWPVSLDFHAQMLAELEVLKPRAVMLDFLLMDAASSTATCNFLSEAARLRDAGTATYVAVTRPDELETLDAGDCRDGAGRRLKPGELLMPVAVRLQVDATDFVNRRYPFEDRAAGEPAGSGLASAAVRMYCDSGRNPDACSARLRRDRAADAGFELAWSPTGDPFNQRWSQARCDEIPSPTHAILFKKALPRETQCPPIATLFASALLSPTEDASLGLRNEDLFDLMEGSLVLVGGNFRGAGDLMTTPLHTRLPGIYYHAVALDNLFAFDGHPKVRKEFRSLRIRYYAFDLCVLWLLAAIYLWRQNWISGVQTTGPFMLSTSARSWIADMVGRLPTVLWVPMAAFALLCLAAFPLLQMISVALAVLLLVAVEVRISTHRDLADRLKSFALYVAALALSLLVVAFAIWLGYRWLSLPPVDWVGYLSFAAVGFFVAHTAILEFARRIDTIHGVHHSQRSGP